MKYKVIELASNKEVKVGMNLLDFRKTIWKYEGMEYAGPPSTGRLWVRPADGGAQRAFYPSVFECKIVEAEND